MDSHIVYIQLILDPYKSLLLKKYYLSSTSFVFFLFPGPFLCSQTSLNCFILKRESFLGYPVFPFRPGKQLIFLHLSHFPNVPKIPVETIAIQPIYQNSLEHLYSSFILCLGDKLALLITFFYLRCYLTCAL